MPRWLVTASVAVLIANPITFVIGFWTAELPWIYASIALAILAVPAIMVVTIALLLWLRTARRSDKGLGP